MNITSMVRWGLQIFTMILVCYIAFADLRYTVRRRRSRNWPATAAKIENSILGPGVIGRVQFNYSYSVNGLQHSGHFYLFVGNGETVELRQRLVGRSVPVKYDDRKPEVSLLMDEVLAGKRVMQGPTWTYN